jgi:hypothetical protein
MPSLIEDAIRQNTSSSHGTVELRRDPEDGRVRLATDRAGPERRNDPHAGRGVVQAPRCVHRSPPKLGRNLATSVETFNSAVGSPERQVPPGARKFTELGVRPTASSRA